MASINLGKEKLPEPSHDCDDSACQGPPAGTP